MDTALLSPLIVESWIRNNNHSIFGQFIQSNCPRFENFRKSKKEVRRDGKGYDLQMFMVHQEYKTILENRLVEFLTSINITQESFVAASKSALEGSRSSHETSDKDASTEGSNEYQQSVNQLLIMVNKYHDFESFAYMMEEEFCRIYNKPIPATPGENNNNNHTLSNETLDHMNNPDKEEAHSFSQAILASYNKLDTKYIKNVRVLWDIENIPVSKYIGGLRTISILNDFMSAMNLLGKGIDNRITAFFNPQKMSDKVLKDLDNAAVELVWVSVKREDADRKLVHRITQEMSVLNSEETVIILITSDKDFRQQLQLLKNNGFQTIVIHRAQHADWVQSLEMYTAAGFFWDEVMGLDKLKELRKEKERSGSLNSEGSRGSRGSNGRSRGNSLVEDGNNNNNTGDMHESYHKDGTPKRQGKGPKREHSKERHHHKAEAYDSTHPFYIQTMKHLFSVAPIVPTPTLALSEIPVQQQTTQTSLEVEAPALLQSDENTHGSDYHVPRHEINIETLELDYMLVSLVNGGHIYIKKDKIMGWHRGVCLRWKGAFGFVSIAVVIERGKRDVILYDDVLEKRKEVNKGKHEKMKGSDEQTTSHEEDVSKEDVLNNSAMSTDNIHHIRQALLVHETHLLCTSAEAVQHHIRHEGVMEGSGGVVEQVPTEEEKQVQGSTAGGDTPVVKGATTHGEDETVKEGMVPDNLIPANMHVPDVAAMFTSTLDDNHVNMTEHSSSSNRSLVLLKVYCHHKAINVAPPRSFLQRHEVMAVNVGPAEKGPKAVLITDIKA